LRPAVARVALVLAGAALASAPLCAQEPVYFQQPSSSFRPTGEILGRYEWTEGFGRNPESQDRWRGRILAGFEWGGDKLRLGAQGDFNYSSDKNDENDPPLIRDNYRSRDARVDLAFLRLAPTRWLSLEGGRFAMPIPFTEMIWDRDLRPQGGALTLSVGDTGSPRLALTGLYAQGSHVFDDDDTRMWVGSATLSVPAGERGAFELTGSYVAFDRLAGLEPAIRRQNTRVAGQFVFDYRVVDLVARLRSEGRLPAQLAADYCWNTGRDEQNKGLWLALVLGSTRTARARLEYVFAKVDRDATLAAYPTDDFLWQTGWEGHKADLGLRAGDKAAFHVIGQLQRFKDSPRAADRDDWVKRLRVELRIRQ
jgi:hypothetical protein